MPISPSPKLRPLRRCLALAAVALAVGAGLSACTPGPTSGPVGRRRAPAPGRSAASGTAATGGDGAGTAAIVPKASTLHWSQCGGTAGGRGVRDARGAAELRRPRRQEDHAGAVDDPGHRAGRQAAGRAAGQPGRAGRARPVARGGGRGRAEPAGGGHLRHRRVRPARGGRFGPRAELRPELLRRGAARLHPGQRGRRAGAHRPGQGLRGRVRAAVRLAAALHDDGQHGPRHGPDPPGIRRIEDQLLRVLLRHLSRPGLRDAVPRPGAPDGARLHRGPDRRLVPGQHRPGLRLPGAARRVLRLDGEVRLRLSPGVHPGGGPGGLLQGPR